MSDPHSEYGVVTGPDSVRFERLLPGPIERVWAYLTESEKRGTWLATGHMDLRPGGRVELRFHHADLSPHAEPIPERFKAMEHGHDSTGHIVACEPRRLLTFSWVEGDTQSEVTFELTARGDKVLLVLNHRRLSNRDMVREVSGGWHAHLGVLADRLNGRVPPPFWSTFLALEAEYADRLAADQK